MSTDTYVDAMGNRHYPADKDCRIVSLVPSLTELLFDLDLEDRIVGRTGFCIHPKAKVKQVPKLGGTKDVKVDKLRALEPTHLIVNVDENRRETVEELAETIPNIVVTHPQGPTDNIELYRLFGGIFGRPDAARQLTDLLHAELARLEALRSELPERRVLYLIWRQPDMTLSSDTYISRMLALINWITVSPDEATRYPTIDDIESLAKNCERILLSSEPYRFREKHLAEYQRLAPNATVMLVDGELVSWYGSRAISGLRYLARLARDETP